MALGFCSNELVIRDPYAAFMTSISGLTMLCKYTVGAFKKDWRVESTTVSASQSGVRQVTSAHKLKNGTCLCGVGPVN